MAAPWWNGPTLWNHYRDLRRSPEDRQARCTALRAAANAVRAVADLHTAGWAHGDIQADHILHAAQGTRLLDLAWAHSPHDALPEDVEAPYTGALVHLEAPETARGLLDGAPATPSPQADVYALGGVLWSCWTGT
jgi:hypothetical protein